MNYLIYGNEQYLINYEINKIIEANNNSCILRYDGSFKDDPTNDVLSNCYNNSLFGDKTIILYKNPKFLISKSDEDSYAEIVDYLNNPNDNCIIIFYSSYESFKSKLKAFKELNLKCETHYYARLDDKKFYDHCINIIKKLNLDIEEPVLDKFIDDCGNDLEIFHNCLKNLKLYNGQITYDVLEQLSYSSNDFDIFSLVNAIIERDVSKSASLIKKIKNDDSSIFGLISLVSSQLMYLYSVSYYSNILKSEKEILEVTKTSNPYRLKMAYKILNKIDDAGILKIVNKLSFLDYEFKNNSNINHSLLFDIFISSLSV